MDANTIIDEFGGTNAVAELFEIKPPSVSEWRTAGIPKARLMCMRLLKPELFQKMRRGASKGKRRGRAA